MKLAYKIIMTLIVISIAGIGRTFVARQSAIATGAISAQQFNDIDMPWGLTVMAHYQNVLLSVLDLLVVIALYFVWRPLFRQLKATPKTETPKAALLLTAVVLGMLLGDNQAQAKVQSMDWAEWVQIGPNETAFLIPVEGANSNTQVQFDSAAFLDKKKVAAKRVQIPHISQANTGVFKNSVVPSAILIRLDRSFVSRTFKGENPNDPCGPNSHCFQFQSREGIVMHAGIAVTAWIPEEKAAQYLYRHGVVKLKIGGPNPEDGSTMSADDVTYASVFEATPLASVMETNIHNEIQALLSQEFGKYSFADALAKQVDIMAAVKSNISKQFGDAGVEISSIGFATPILFPVAIQDALNAVTASQNQAAALAAFRAVMDVKNAQADIDVKLAFADAVRKGNLPKLPSFIVIPDTAPKWLTSLFGFWSGSDTAPAKK